jgi:hypothetical protein
MKVAFNMGFLPEDFVSKSSILLLGNQHIKERDALILFYLHGELNVFRETINVLKKLVQFIISMGPLYIGVVYIYLPSL